MQEFRSRGAAQQAVEALRIRANKEMDGDDCAPSTILGLVEHYRLKEMPMDTHEEKTRGTKLVYHSVLNHHIVPRWGGYALRASPV